MRPVRRQRVVYVSIAAGLKAGGQVFFQDQQDLKDAKITAVETFTSDDVTQGPSGTPAITAADAARTVLSISEKSDERVKEVPYLAFRTTQNAGEPRTYEDIEIEWTQCYVRAVQDYAGGPFVLPVLVSFYYPKRDGQPSRASAPMRRPVQRQRR